jgi:hypothetical protein
MERIATLKHPGLLALVIPFEENEVLGIQPILQNSHVLHSCLGSRPFPETLQYAGKDSQGQTLKLIKNIHKNTAVKFL